MPRTRTNQAGIEFVLISPGSFMMGSDSGHDNEKPAHKVVISKPFFIGKYEVTQAQWQAVMGTNPSPFKRGNLPVEYANWHNADQFVKKLNEMNDGFEYRLPTEAEWEYACRAGTTGDYAGALDLMAWYANNSGDNYLDASEIWRTDKTNYAKRLIGNRSQTHPVGTKQPNAFGLYDMLGNVEEWCQDWYDAKYYRTSPGADPQGPAAGESQVLRGGSWASVGYRLRSSNRSTSEPYDMFIPTIVPGSPNLIGRGFRVVAVARTQ